jgi:uncharacterized DUF497 family protein
VRFDWDPTKDAANRRKHGLSFDEASVLFGSPDGWLEQIDETHGDDEDRFLAIGLIARGVAAVVFVERDEDVIRLVSARFGTPREIRMYDAWVRRRKP